jgi:hypothetical protein
VCSGLCSHTAEDEHRGVERASGKELWDVQAEVGARLPALVREQNLESRMENRQQSQNTPSPFKCLESYSGTAKFRITSSRTKVKERERRLCRQDQRLSTALLYLTGHTPSISDGCKWRRVAIGRANARGSRESNRRGKPQPDHDPAIPPLPPFTSNLAVACCLASPMQMQMQMTRCFFRSLHHQGSRAAPGSQQSRCGFKSNDFALQHTPPPPWSVLPGRDFCTTSSSRL